MNRCKVIVNPFAGKGKAGRSLPMIKETLDRLKIDYDLCVTEHMWHAAELAEKAIIEGFDTVAAVGGDGTANEVINGIMLARKNGIGDARLAVLPIGRGNDFAFGMEAPLEFHQACQALAIGKTRRIDLGLVKGGLYPEGRYFGNGIGIGFDTMVGFIASKLPLSGFLAYLVATFKTAQIYFPAPIMRIELDDTETITQPTLMCSVMNGRRMGGGFLMAPFSKSNDGLFDLCIVREVSRPAMLTIIPLFFKGTQASNPAVKMRRARRLTVTAEKGTLPVHSDGETICAEGTELYLEMIPDQIEMIYEPQEG